MYLVFKIIFYNKIIKGTHLNKNGIGFDIHIFTEGNFIRLGGVKIKSNFGLKANSDGDVVIHSITDAILGALEKNDIGSHFSPDNENYKDADSKIFLDKALNYLNEVDGEIINLDTNIICDIPRIEPFRKDIKKNLSKLSVFYQISIRYWHFIEQAQRNPIKLKYAVGSILLRK